ncbi:MAG: translation initiation factor IF-6 [Candidatus Methanomethylophilus sp.]|nr:translation initiation factor IF-6 [Methanomethylophilus sp.]MDD3233536.1 translation initiation factor IF-6 [Methanomethylophilus sp.]MDD4222363.1 translation initiation factor IF-6 [Methanomethylophilus sp.]MDD4668339.1 translation initiation factor IF-6 [Methanomethylophilus sp.]
MSMRLSRVNGTFNIGVNAAVNESLAFIPPDAEPSFQTDLEEALGVRVYRTTVAGSHVPGSLIAMNSYGAAVSELAEESELEYIRKDLPVVLIPDRLNAAGNNILVNDNGALVNPEMGDSAVKELARLFNVEVVRATVAGANTVGSLCRCTNRGCVCTTDATDDDLAVIRDVLKVDVVRTTVNHGVQYVGAGVVANSTGALIGDLTTPIEMSRVSDGLGL